MATPGGQPASIMSTRAPATGPAARGDVLPIIGVVAEAPKGRASSASAGFGGGGVRATWRADESTRAERARMGKGRIGGGRVPALRARGRSPYRIQLASIETISIK